MEMMAGFEPATSSLPKVKIRLVSVCDHAVDSGKKSSFASADGLFFYAWIAVLQRLLQMLPTISHELKSNVKKDCEEEQAEDTRSSCVQTRQNGGSKEMNVYLFFCPLKNMSNPATI